MSSLDPTLRTLVRPALRERIRVGRCAPGLDLDPAGRWLRFQVEPVPTTGVAARREAHEAQVAADTALAAPYLSVEEAEVQVDLSVRLQQIADERRELAHDLEVAETGRAMSRLDDLRAVLALTRRQRYLAASPHRRRPDPAPRPIACGARARSSHGSSPRSRGSRRSTTRSTGGGDSGGDGPGEPEPPRRPLRDLSAVAR